MRVCEAEPSSWIEEEDEEVVDTDAGSGSAGGIGAVIDAILCCEVWRDNERCAGEWRRREFIQSAAARQLLRCGCSEPR